MSNRIRKSLILLMTFVLAVSVFAGCGGGGQPASNQPQQSGGGTTPAAPAAPAGSESSGSAMPTSPLPAGEWYKYDPPISASFGKPLDINGAGIVAMEQHGEPYDNNRWIQYFRDEVGVESTYHLLAPNTIEYDQKLLLAMASADLPDIFWVTNLSMLKQLMDAGAIHDMTDHYATHANPTLREVIEFEGEEIFYPVTFNDRRWAIPVKMPSTNEYSRVWVRQDWLTELGLERPKTMDDVRAITQAFKDHYPNNVGMMISNQFIEEQKGIFWAFGGGHGRRKQWNYAGDGTVAFSEVQPEMKGGLAWLRDMYADGLINQEFGTEDITKAFEHIADNRSGIFYGPHWYGFRLHNSAASLDPGADFIPMGLPTGNGQSVKVYGSNCFDAVYAVRADYPHPEALVHLFNAYEEKLFGANNDFDNFFSSEHNTGTWSAGPIHALHPLVDLIPHREMKAAYPDKMDTLTGGAKSFWNYIETGQKAYQYMFGPVDSCFIQVDESYPDGISWNAYIGAPTPTWADRWSSLQELIDTTYLQIVQGQLDLDTGFDNMVEQWHALGGEQITREVNEIVATYK